MPFSDLFEALAFVPHLITAVLGILAVITPTKDEQGKVTPWGKLTIACICVSSVISQAIEANKDAKENSRHHVNATTQALLLRKTEQALESQLELLGKTDGLITNVNSSYQLQRDVLFNTLRINNNVEDNLLMQEGLIRMDSALFESQLHVLGTQKRVVESQNGIIDGMVLTNHRIQETLNPLTPFAIEYRMKYKVTKAIMKKERDYESLLELISSDSVLINPTGKALRAGERSRTLLATKGIHWFSTYDPSSKRYVSRYLITAESPYFKKLKHNLLLHVYLYLEKPSKVANAPAGFDLMARCYAEPKQVENVLPANLTKAAGHGEPLSFNLNDLGTYFIYNPTNNEMTYCSAFKNVIVDEDTGRFNSVYDLKNHFLRIEASGCPPGAEIEELALCFGENFGRKYSLSVSSDEITYITANDLVLTHHLNDFK